MRVGIYSGVFRQRNLDHGMRAGWTSTSGFSFAFDCVEPKWIDRLGRKCAPQELEADRTPTTGVARPKKAIRHTHLFQRQIAPRTEKFSFHISASLSSTTRGTWITARIRDSKPAE